MLVDHDEAGHQRPTVSIDDFGAGGSRNGPADSGDAAVAYQHVLVLDRLPMNAVEEPRVLDQDHRLIRRDERLDRLAVCVRSLRGGSSR